MCRNSLPWAAQKQLNQSRFHSGNGMSLAKGTMYQMGIQITICEVAILREKKGQSRTCPTYPAVDILKVTQQEVASVWCGYQLGCTKWRCTLAQPGEYDWIHRMRRQCGLTSNYFDHLFYGITAGSVGSSKRSVEYNLSKQQRQRTEEKYRATKK